MSKKVRNLPASVRARLETLSRERGEDFQLVLQRYAAERLLYRMGQSAYRDRLVLKGARLFALWGIAGYRATRDLDLLGYGRGDTESVARCFREICTLAVAEDGLRFLPDTLRVEEIRDAAECGGVRVRIEVRLEQARIPLQIDVGFGDAIMPPAAEEDYPTLLGGPPPRVLAYPREALVAEKLHAMVILGTLNSRLKDFYDVLMCSQNFEFDSRVLGSAIASTFDRRRTPLPGSTPPCLAPAFFEDAARIEQWLAFVRRSGLTDVLDDFASVGESLRAFIVPILESPGSGSAAHLTWQPGGPWR